MDQESGRVASPPGCEPTASAASGVFAESHPSRGAWDGYSRTYDGKRLRETRVLLRRGRWQVLLMPRGRRRDYVCAWEPTPPIRFGYFRRNSYNTTLGIFLPALPRIGAWRLIISRHAKWLARDRDRDPGGAETAKLAQSSEAR